MTDRESAEDDDHAHRSRTDDRRGADRGAPWAGVVLAGGGSTRFGDADKLLAELDGTPLVRRVADRLAARTDRLVVSARPGKREVVRDVLAGVTAEVTVLPDPEPDRGPLAGMAVGLDAVSGRHEYGAVVAGDMPFVAPALLDHLHDRAAPDHDVALVRSEAGWYNTTQAVYRADAVARGCERVLADGGGRILDAFDGLDTLTVEERELDGVVPTETFFDVDTREDLAAARDLL
ncbi:MAG: molybdenum cofactor guanylyltransferase [Haloarculaceae archaeon]